nr:golgin candidate 6 isoform X2 [Tanacetum cinerariifolium]
MEVRALKSGGATPSPDIEKIKAEAREEAQKESEGELGDLLVCLGQEQTKVEKLSARLLELGEDRNVMDHLLMLGVESQWAPVAVRCAAFQCIGDLIYGHRQNLDVFASKSLGDEREVEPALNSILRIILRTSSMQEFIAADYIFKSFCEQNSDGQKMLASTLIPQPMSMTNARFEEDVNMSFGSMLLHGLAMSEHDGDLETSCRAASVLSHVMKDNIQCKEKVHELMLLQ